MIDWEKLTKEELEQIKKICTRAMHLQEEQGLSRLKYMDLEMDLGATHRDTPLNLKLLLSFDNFHFIHDVWGIARNLNRRTGKLENGFLPRCARSQYFCPQCGVAWFIHEADGSCPAETAEKRR